MEEFLLIQGQKTQGIISWGITSACNFSCEYCVSKNKVSTRKILDVKKIPAVKKCWMLKTVKILKSLENEWTIIITGGEPFLYPGFTELCREVTKDFKISVNTNLSINCEIQKWVEHIAPDKVKQINASLHIEESEKHNAVEDFIQNTLLFKKKGFHIFHNYVLVPSLIKRFKKDYEYFKSREIELWPIPFRGCYEDRRYPDAYSDEAKELIQRYNPYPLWYPFNFKGIKCNAGKTFIRIEENGTVVRCCQDNKVLGDIFNGIILNKKAEPCRAYECPCYGEKLVKKNPYMGKKNFFSNRWYSLKYAEHI